MAWDNKVVWSEGMFLRPQHLQQFDRYVEKLVRGRVAGLRPYPWGITELQINRELLTIGKFAVTACQGVLEDGTPFRIPEDADHPPPLVLPDNTRNCIVYLTLPVRQPGGIEVDRSDNAETVARYAWEDYEARDTNADSEAVALPDKAGLRIGKLRLSYRLETDERAGFICLGLARVVEVRSDKNVVLDDRYIPPSLVCHASPTLFGFIAELQGLFHHRGEAVGARVADSGTKGAAEIADFLLLQLVNRYEPLLTHMATATDIHPETFYARALEMAGELASFTAPTKRPPAFPPYRHDDLQRSFAPLMAELRRSLSAVLEVSAIPIPLQERKFGVRVGVIADKSLLTGAVFVLAVKAAMSPELLRRHLPTQIAIGPTEQIRDLVNSQLPGIKVRPLPVAPRQLPYHAGATYFELDRSNEYWKALATSGGIAIHLAGEFPQVEMELWAIRG